VTLTRPSPLRGVGSLSRFKARERESEKSPGKAVAEHGQAADGLGLGRLVLEHVPMLGELAV
jgi:hypothetical protein